MSQSHDLHRALLRPAIVHTLRAAGFHSTKPSVLDTLVNLAERHLQLLAATTAQHAHASHNDAVPTVTDVRMALADCGVLIPFTDAAEEGWRERWRRPLAALADVPQGGQLRVAAEKRKRDEEDTRDVRAFGRWFDGGDDDDHHGHGNGGLAWREIKRVAGMLPPDAGAVGVGGGVVVAEDFLAGLKKKYGKAGDETRLQGTVLGKAADDRELTVDGGPVASVREWKPRLEERSANIQVAAAAATATTAMAAAVKGEDTLQGEQATSGESTTGGEVGNDAG